MAFSGPESDRLAIRELYGTYSDCATRLDRDGWLALYVPEGEWHIRGEQACGHAALGALWDELLAGITAMGFFAEIGALEISGDTARGRVSCREIFQLENGRIHKVVGQYEDLLVRTAGDWRFARRQYTVLLRE